MAPGVVICGAQVFDNRSDLTLGESFALHQCLGNRDHFRPVVIEQLLGLGRDLREDQLLRFAGVALRQKLRPVECILTILFGVAGTNIDMDVGWTSSQPSC